MNRSNRIPRRPWAHVALVAAAIAATAGCSPSKYAVGNVMVPILDNARDAAFASDDLRTFCDAAPSNIFLIEGLARTDPENREIRVQAAMLYFAYAFASVEDDDSDYASLLYQKGLAHGYSALAKGGRVPPRPDIAFEEFEAALPALRKKDVPAAVWTAVNWVQFISLHLDSTAVLRDIPKVMGLLERVAALDPEYFQGLPHIMIGSLHAFKPPVMGGDPEASAESFAKAFAISADSFLLSKYFYARFYTYRMQDADLFEKILESVLEKPVEPDDPYRLLNLIAKEKSRRLLGDIDELF